MVGWFSGTGNTSHLLGLTAIEVLDLEEAPIPLVVSGSND
jgi:hypothetical protein